MALACSTGSCSMRSRRTRRRRSTDCHPHREQAAAGRRLRRHSPESCGADGCRCGEGVRHRDRTTRRQSGRAARAPARLGAAGRCRSGATATLDRSDPGLVHALGVELMARMGPRGQTLVQEAARKCGRPCSSTCASRRRSTTSTSRYSSRNARPPKRLRAPRPEPDALRLAPRRRRQ